MWTTLFWKDVAERSIKTFAQTLLALVISAGATSIVTINWPVFLGVAATAAVVSLLTSIGSAVGTQGTSTVSPASAATDSRGTTL